MNEIPKEELKIIKIVSNNKVEYLLLSLKGILPISRF